LIYFKVCTFKVSDKTDAFLLNYSNLFWGYTFFIRTQCRWHRCTATHSSSPTLTPVCLRSKRPRLSN